MTEFKKTNEFQSGHLVGSFTCSYADLVRIFGEPGDMTDEYKVSTQWSVTDGTQHFEIYDYKETCTYDEDLPTIEEFRAWPEYDWHIGGTVKPTSLVEFLKSKIG